MASFFILPVHGQEWTRFRGPNGNGGSEAAWIPTQWTKQDYNWNVELPGIGHSSPVIWGDRIFLMSAAEDGTAQYAICVHADDGQHIWQREEPMRPYHVHARSSLASSSPAVDDRHVYVVWTSGAALPPAEGKQRTCVADQTTLVALTHDGDEVWRRDLGAYESNHGFGTSPIIYNDLVILSKLPKATESGLDTGSYCSVFAMDRMTGETRWETSRNPGQKTSYSVPCVFNPPDGRPQLVSCSTVHGMFALDITTGEELWTIDVFRMRTVSSPFVAGGLVFGATGSGRGGNYVVAVRPGQRPEVAYEVTTQAPYVPTSVPYEDLLFLWSDKGIVTCVKTASGEVVWKKRVGGNYSGSPVRAGNAIYCVSEDGEVVAVAASDKYELLGRSQLDKPSRSTPAVSGGRMYLRTYSHLFSIGGN